MWIRHRNPNADRRREIKTMLGNAVPRLKPAQTTKPSSPTRIEKNDIHVWVGGLPPMTFHKVQTPQEASNGIPTDVATSFPRPVQPVALDMVKTKVCGHSPNKSVASSNASAAQSNKSNKLPASFNHDPNKGQTQQQPKRESGTRQRSSMADRLLQGPSCVSIIANAIACGAIGLVAQDCFGNQWWLVERDRNDIIWALQDWDAETQGRDNPWAVKHVTMHGLTYDKERVWVRIRNARGYWQGLHLDSIPCDEQLRTIYWNQFPMSNHI